MLAQIEPVVGIEFQHQLRNAPEIASAMVHREREPRPPSANCILAAAQRIDFSAFDVHLNVGQRSAARTSSIVVTGISISPSAAKMAPRLASSRNRRCAAVAVQAGMKRMDPRFVAEIVFQFGECDRVRLEGIDVGKPPAHPLDEATDRIAIIGAAIDVDFLVGEIEQSLGRVKIVLGDNRLQNERIERLAKSNDRIRAPGASDHRPGSCAALDTPSGGPTDRPADSS